MIRIFVEGSSVSDNSSASVLVSFVVVSFLSHISTFANRFRAISNSRLIVEMIFRVKSLLLDAVWWVECRTAFLIVAIFVVRLVNLGS